MDTQKRIFLIILEIALWAGAVGTHLWLWDRWVIPDGPHGEYRWVGMDFVPFHVGVQEMFKGADPYSTETLQKIQQVVYGGPANGEDPMMFVYPAWLFLIIAPLALLPLPLAAALYSGTLLWGLLNMMFILANQWSGPHFYKQIYWMLILILGSLPFLIISVTKGQLGYLSLAALFVTRKIWNKSPFWAGMVLGLAIIKPTVTVIPTAGCLLWALLEKNWKVLGGFTAIMSILLAASLAFAGNWIPGYLAMLSINGGMPVIWSFSTLTGFWRVAYALAIAALTLASFWLSWQSKDKRFWLSATALAGIAFFPMRWIYDLFLGILVPSDESGLTPLQWIAVSIAVLAPWVLVVFPAPQRWDVAVVGLPIAWAGALATIIFKNKGASAA